MSKKLRTAAQILEFWFGQPHHLVGGERSTFCEAQFLKDRWPVWFFGRDPEFDAVQKSSEARELLDSLLVQADKDACAQPLKETCVDADWGLPANGAGLAVVSDSSPAGFLARLIVLDQFPRCAFRGTASAFKYDRAACSIAESMTSQPYFQSALTALDRFFISLALQHSENIDIQTLGWQIARTLVDVQRVNPADGPGAAGVAAFLRGLKGFPDEHYDCIKEFGRFPHRNALLRRRSTTAELEWVLSPSCPGWAKSQQRADPRKMTLIYFDGRGMGEVVRFVLAYVGQPYDEEFVPSRAAFLRLRDGDFQLPFGQIPVLRISSQRNADSDSNEVASRDNVLIGQTQAIVEFLARTYNYLGLLGDSCAHTGNAESRAIVCMAFQSIMDARLPLVNIHFNADPDDARFAFQTQRLPKFLKYFERLLESQTHHSVLNQLPREEDCIKTPFLCGETPSFADIALCEFIVYAREELTGSQLPSPNEKASYPKTTAAVEALRSHPRIKRHVTFHICSFR